MFLLQTYNFTSCNIKLFVFSGEGDKGDGDINEITEKLDEQKIEDQAQNGAEEEGGGCTTFNPSFLKMEYCIEHNSHDIVSGFGFPASFPLHRSTVLSMLSFSCQSHYEYHKCSYFKKKIFTIMSPS